MLASLVGGGAVAHAPDTPILDAGDNIYLTDNQADWLDMLNYDNVVAMARKLSEAPFGSRVGGSFRMDMTVTYLMDRLTEWGYEPQIHHFDTTGPNFQTGPGGSPNRRFNNGYVQIGDMRYMLYGPAFGANTVYSWAMAGGSVTANVTGTAVINWPGEPGALAQAAAFPEGSFEIPAGVNVSGRVVFVTLGDGPTQHQAGMIHPNGDRIYEAVLELQEAGARAVVFQSRPARYSFVSALPPFNSDPEDPDTWTWGDSVHGRLANRAEGTRITIPVGLTSHWEIHETVTAFGTGDNTSVRVHMATRSDGQNVLATHYGTGENAMNIYLGNHPDSVVSAPGFNDTIITTALQMEMMRVLAYYDIQTYHNIVFGAWDFEENGLLGARYYVYDMSEEAQAQFWGNFNMDMVATGQPECIYIHVNITTPVYGTAQTSNPEIPVGNLQFYLRQIQDHQRLIDHPGAFAYANQFGVFINSFLAVQQLADDGRHEDRTIVVDPSHHRHGEPFDIKYHFTITWGQTTDQAAFVQPALAGQVHENLKNAMQFDWRRNARGFVGGQFPAEWEPGTAITLPGLGIVPVLELLYHKVGDTYEDNFSRDRLEVVGDIVWLALYHSAGVMEPAHVRFPDVPEDHWSRGYALEAADRGIIRGIWCEYVFEDYIFDPYGSFTRAMAAQIMWNIADNPAPESTDAPFTDVAPDMWYTNAITWVAETGVVTGHGDGTFAPYDPLTRQQLFVLFRNFAQAHKELDITVGGQEWPFFNDHTQLADWADAAAQWLTYVEILEGTGGGYLQPLNDTTRAEGAALVVRFARQFMDD